MTITTIDRPTRSDLGLVEVPTGDTPGGSCGLEIGCATVECSPEPEGGAA